MYRTGSGWNGVFGEHGNPRGKNGCFSNAMFVFGSVTVPVVNPSNIFLSNKDNNFTLKLCQMKEFWLQKSALKD